MDTLYISIKSIYVSVFPQGCEFYRGPHSLDCLKSIWLEVGCTLEGESSPGKLSRQLLNYLTTSTLV